jgi:hypothetical protein
MMTCQMKLFSYLGNLRKARKEATNFICSFNSSFSECTVAPESLLPYLSVLAPVSREQLRIIDKTHR